MRRMENREKWTLTILRIGSDEFSSDLEDARFRFGRHKMELSDPEQDATRLPSGLIELVRQANLEEQALETGITVEMSTLDRPAPEWKEFWSTATIFPDVPWSSPRTLYTSSSGSSVEVIQILSCSSLPKRMPGRIFIRAAPLQESVVFWAMENEVIEDSLNPDRVSCLYFREEAGAWMKNFQPGSMEQKFINDFVR